MKFAIAIISAFILTGCTYWYVPSQPHAPVSVTSHSNDSIRKELRQNSSQTQESDLIGTYAYPRTGWYAGYYLQMNNDNDFSETTYSDIPTKNRIFRGKYHLENDTLELHYRKLFNNDFKFKVINIDSNIFLVPLTKLDTFYKIYGEKRHEIVKIQELAKSDTTTSDSELKRLKYNTMNEIGFLKIK